MHDSYLINTAPSSNASSVQQLAAAHLLLRSAITDNLRAHGDVMCDEQREVLLHQLKLSTECEPSPTEKCTSLAFYRGLYSH